ncbi:MAG: hypothetical protein VXY88_04900, partial [Bacteroidota bacterium]|nr:hypothetical protein [Bacteroidota bacterium]
MSLKINPALFNIKFFLYVFVIAVLYGIVKGCSNEASETILQTESTVSENNKFGYNFNNYSVVY